MSTGLLRTLQDTLIYLRFHLDIYRHTPYAAEHLNLPAPGIPCRLLLVYVSPVRRHSTFCVNRA